MSHPLVVKELIDSFNHFQKVYGEKNLDPIYGAGCINEPKAFFVFMNPTAKNFSSSKKWRGLKAPWLGTKNIWKLFSSLGLLDLNLYNKICSETSKDWNNDFARAIYENIATNGAYLTNLAKCTQIDARPLKNNIFRAYLPLLKKEISIIKPRLILTFGNQVSSIFLNQPISVSKTRRKAFSMPLHGNKYEAYPVYYPVGQGLRNMDKAIEDLRAILKLCT